MNRYFLITRVFGVVVGIVLIVGAIVPVGGGSWGLSNATLALQFSIGLLLVFPWSRFQTSSAIAFYILVACTLAILPHDARVLVHTLSNPDFPPSERIVFSVLHILLLLILFAQIPIIWFLRKGTSQSFPLR